MKQFSMKGFENYAINEDGSIVNTKTGKTLVADAKGIVKMKASSDDADNSIVKGETYKYKAEELKALGDSQNLWAEPATTETAAEPAKEMTAEEKEAYEIASKKKELKNAIEAAKKKLIAGNTTDELMAAKI